MINYIYHILCCIWNKFPCWHDWKEYIEPGQTYIPYAYTIRAEYTCKKCGKKVIEYI